MPGSVITSQVAATCATKLGRLRREAANHGNHELPSDPVQLDFTAALRYRDLLIHSCREANDRRGMRR